MNTRQAYRLTAQDEERVRTRIRETLVGWDRQRRAARGYGIIIEATEREALARVGAHAIGCAQADLRPVELTWITDQVDAIILDYSGLS